MRTGGVGAAAAAAIAAGSSALLFPSIVDSYSMSSVGKHGVVAELSFAKRGQSTPALTAISLSSDQRHAVVGGHGIMKVRVNEFVFPYIC